MNPTIKLNPEAAKSAEIYRDALLDACKRAKVEDPTSALTDADDYPKLLKMETVEYAIGWLNGCAEAHGVTVEVLWNHIAIGAREVSRRKRAA